MGAALDWLRVSVRLDLSDEDGGDVSELVPREWRDSDVLLSVTLQETIRHRGTLANGQLWSLDLPEPTGQTVAAVAIIAENAVEFRVRPDGAAGLVTLKGTHLLLCSDSNSADTLIETSIDNPVIVANTLAGAATKFWVLAVVA